MVWRTWDLNLKVRLVGELITHTFFWMYFPFMALYFSDSFGKDIAGIMLMVPPLLGMMSNLFGGYLADKVGRKPTMLLSLYIVGDVCHFCLFQLPCCRLSCLHRHWDCQLSLLASQLRDGGGPDD